MHAWSGEGGDIMGPTVAGVASAKVTTPPLKNGSDLRESGYLIAVGSRTARFRRRHMNKMLLLLIALFILLILVALLVFIILYVKVKMHKPIPICTSKECLRSAANLALSMDTSVNPCDDFYEYVCGNWATEHPRPDSQRSYDWFRDKQNKVYALVRDFLNANTSGQPLPVQQAKDLYAACMDTGKLDKVGLKPVFKVLESLDLPAYPTLINATDDIEYDSYNFDWLETVIKIKTHLGMDVLIGFDIFSDPKNSTVYRLVMGSPETTNPFPSTYNTKKKHRLKPSLRSNHGEKYKGYFVAEQEQYVDYSQEKKKDSDDESDHIYKLYYAEIMKIFAMESGKLKDSKLDEVQLDQNIILTADQYLDVSNEVFEFESYNDTNDDSDFDLSIPEYTVNEIQIETDMFLESNNETSQPIWKRYLEGIFSISNVTLDFETDKVLVAPPDMAYMKAMASFVSRTHSAILELYIWVKVAEVMAVHTTKELRVLFQRSYDEMHKHLESPAPSRSLQCAVATNELMGMAVAYAIVDPNFIDITKPKIQTMLNEIKNALAHLIGKTKWMDDDTKLATYQKIINMRTMIGLPTWFHEEGRLEQYYEGIEVSRDTHLQNMINIIQAKIKNSLSSYRDSKHITWATDPTDVNAFHTFQENTIKELSDIRSCRIDIDGKLDSDKRELISKSIGNYQHFTEDGSPVLPRGVSFLRVIKVSTVPMVMLQYPFFDLGLASLNYGSLGTILGHEITHGFDNFGRKFDKNGNLLPWWSNSTIESFINMTQCFVDQYSGYYLPELHEHLDGKKTLGENIADNGGVREALAAFKHHLHKYGPEKKLPGFEHMTPEQMFFLSYGNDVLVRYPSLRIWQRYRFLNGATAVRPPQPKGKTESFLVMVWNFYKGLSAGRFRR